MKLKIAFLLILVVGALVLTQYRGQINGRPKFIIKDGTNIVPNYYRFGK